MVNELEEESGISHGTIQRIISDHLQLKKVTALYVPKHLTNFQKVERLRIYQENLFKFEQGVWRLCDVVTGDEPWVFSQANWPKIIECCLGSTWRSSSNGGSM